MRTLWNPTVAGITLRALLGRARFLVLLGLPVLLVGLAILVTALGADPAAWVPPVVLGLGFGVVLPVTALVIGSGVLGSEIDDGTVVHILTKPLPRREIIFTKLGVAIAVTLVTVGLPMLAVGTIAGSVRGPALQGPGNLGLGLVAGVALGTVAYCALFLALSLVTRRPVLLGLVYVIVWEGLLSNILSGTRVLSIEQYSIAVAAKVSGSPYLHATVAVPLATIMAAVFLVAGTTLAIDRLRSFSIAGETS
jgi:ABC-2 type transport system permease protein